MIKNIIFDFGGVLVDWNPRYLYRQLFDNEEEMEDFLTNVCTNDWNEQQDEGRLLAEGTAALSNCYPDKVALIEAYYGRWEEMLGGAIAETVTILRRLKNSGQYQLYGLTNWSAETFPIALQKFDFFALFDGIVVSGVEKMRKPNPAFFQLLLDRYSLKAEECLFIDDNSRNTAAAQTFGIPSITFKNTEGLWEALKLRGLL